MGDVKSVMKCKRPWSGGSTSWRSLMVLQSCHWQTGMPPDTIFSSDASLKECGGVE